MIAMIAAMDENRVIGKANDLPWDLPEDLKNFKRITSGNTVIMGRRTYESIGFPLPKRNNIVISRSMEPSEDVDVVGSIAEAVEKAKEYNDDVFVIGGQSIYEQMLPLADKLYLSHVHMEVEGDAYFPKLDYENWEVEEEKEYDQFTFRIYKRK